MRVNTDSAVTASTLDSGVGNIQGGRSDVLSQVISSRPSRDWSAVLQQSMDRFRIGAQKAPSVAQHMQQMGDLLKIQSDISRYQLKVELVSKVSEGAVASVRKLQQNQ